MIVYDGCKDREACKNVFGRVIEQLAKEDPDVVYLDTSLMDSFGTSGFWERNKRQVINCGMGEANMMGIAAGLSAGGKKPYVHTSGPSASRRCFDQAFLSIAYAGNSVRIFGSDPGVAAAFNGGTRMAFEDMAVMRTIPLSTVIDISDAAMLENLMRKSKNMQGLVYFRVARKSSPRIYSRDHDFTIGKGEIVQDGSDLTIIACGLMVGEALKASAMLKEQKISARIVDMFTVKPLDAKLVDKCAKETGFILTTENHSVIGGLGDAVAAALLESGIPAYMRKHGVRDEFGSVGPQDYLMDRYGLTAEQIVKVIMRNKGKIQ
jgi:transketolase